MAEQDEVIAELKGTTKAKLMQKYSSRMNEIVQSYGGNITDLPIDRDHEYYKLQAKLQILNRM